MSSENASPGMMMYPKCHRPNVPCCCLQEQDISHCTLISNGLFYCKLCENTVEELTIHNNTPFTYFFVRSDRPVVSADDILISKLLLVDLDELLLKFGGAIRPINVIACIVGDACNPYDNNVEHDDEESLSLFCSIVVAMGRAEVWRGAQKVCAIFGTIECLLDRDCFYDKRRNSHKSHKKT